MDSRLTRWCDGFLEACWLVAILATPLFFNIHSERIFEPDKIALLRSIAILMIATWVIRFIDQKGWRDLGRWRFSNPDSFWHRPFVLPVLLLVLVYFLSTLFSVTPRISLVGSYQRLQGTYTMLAYVVIFATIATRIRSGHQVRRLVTVTILGSIPVALYGMVQHFGHDPLPWGGNVQVRVAGHLGNAIFIAAYLIMVIPLTLSRVIEAFTNILGTEKLEPADMIRASVYIFVLATQLLTLYWSGSRGPLIGLGVGLFSFLLVLLVSLRNQTGTAARSRMREALPAILFLIPMVIAILLSPAISDAVGSLVALVLFFGVVSLSILAIFLLVAARRGWSWLWLAWILLTLLVGAWLLLFNIPSERTAGLREMPVVAPVLDVLDDWRDLPVVGSFGRMLDPSQTSGREKSGRVRVLIWQGVIDLISPHSPLLYPDGRTDVFNWLRPVLGYGPESMYTAYNRFYPPELATVEARNASPDRSHNETFDTLVITGLTGLVAWQFLYLTVVHFAFRFLGVVRSRRDSWVLAVLWIGGAILATALALAFAGPVYVGVAVPTGVIAGLIAYLIYYALFGRPAGSETSGSLPFAADHLLMNALTAAVLAHYVEIHFGIAVAVTRLYFFAFAGLMIALSLQSARKSEPVIETGAGSPPTTEKRRKRKVLSETSVAAPSGVATLLAPMLLMTIVLGLLGYNFVSYALPPGKVITGPADLSALDIFRQSLLQNARSDFVDWPFIYAVMVLSWLLGWLMVLSEMVKQGDLALPKASRALPHRRIRFAALIFVALALAAFGSWLTTSPDTATVALGGGLALLGAPVCAASAALLLLNRNSAREIGAWSAVALMVLAPVVLLAGGTIAGVVIAAAGSLVLWLLWDGGWRGTYAPMALAVAGSFALGIAYVFAHAARYRALLFVGGNAAVDSAAQLRALEASQAGTLLSWFNAFALLILVALGFALSRTGSVDSRLPRTHAPGALVYAMVGLAMAAALFVIFRSNVLPIQADMVFKRARPFDDQATRLGQTNPTDALGSWDIAIAIYERAIALEPLEDFYYLFLGRAYLERAGITADRAEQTALLTRAESILLQAQSINPLNTDHTANLARLNTRWLTATEDDAESEERLRLAEEYYQRALTLSPQNSIIRNEFATLVLEVKRDCDLALAVFDESAEIDPFYADTYLARADAYVTCSSGRSQLERNAMLQTAADSLNRALEIAPDNVLTWVRLANVYRQLGSLEQAFAALEDARLRNTPAVVPPGELDFLGAQIAADLGNEAEARRLAEGALGIAGQDLAGVIEAFLQDLGTEPGE